MPYLGNSPTSNFASVTKDTFSGNASTTAFTLSKPATTNGVAVYVENVRQIPTTAYSVSGTTLTFTGTPPSGTNNIYVMHHNTPVSTATHPAAQDLTAVNGTMTGTLAVTGTSTLTGATTVGGTSNLTIADGNLVVGTSGKGISFAATGDPTQGSGTSELLDDYEEGTWTPTLLGSSSHPSITTSVAAGKFVRIGGLVFIQWNMIITNVASSGSGNAQVGGLPYAMVGNTYQGHIGIMYNDVWSNETQKGYIPNGGAYISLVPTGRTQTNLGVGTVSTGYFGGGGSYTIV